MTKEEKIIDMGTKLPHGSKKRIAKLSGISVQTVVNFFKTGTAKPETSLKIIETARPFYVSYQKLREAQMELLDLF
jgi:DNA invertase Pin-like site-specific DNA recombinase